MHPTDRGVDVTTLVREMAEAARAASHVMAHSTTAQKNCALRSIASHIRESIDAILDSNKVDLQKASDLDRSQTERLELNETRVEAMAAGILEVESLADPVGSITDLNYRPSGIQVGRMRVPLGVVGIIYESRPNVTADTAALCLKSGNAAILRGGSEALLSSRAILACVTAGLNAAGLPRDAIQMVNITDRMAVGAMLSLDGLIDVIVPRGGKGLIERVSAEARVPVIKHLDGVCHVFLDDYADVDKAHRIAFNAKTQRYGTCNTMETLLATPDTASKVFPTLLDDYHKAGVELRGCPKTCSYNPHVTPSTEADWYEEFLAPVLAIRIVENIDNAITHIRKYGSQHTDAIVTENLERDETIATCCVRLGFHPHPVGYRSPTWCFSVNNT